MSDSICGMEECGIEEAEEWAIWSSWCDCLNYLESHLQGKHLSFNLSTTVSLFSIKPNSVSASIEVILTVYTHLCLLVVDLDP